MPEFLRFATVNGDRALLPIGTIQSVSVPSKRDDAPDKCLSVIETPYRTWWSAESVEMIDARLTGQGE